MVTEALKTLDSRKGSSRSKILNHLKTTYGIESGKSANKYLRAALEALLEESVIALAKGTGYNNGYYRITPKGKNLKPDDQHQKKNHLHVQDQNQNQLNKLLVVVNGQVQKVNHNLRKKVKLVLVNHQQNANNQNHQQNENNQNHQQKNDNNQNHQVKKNLQVVNHHHQNDHDHDHQLKNNLLLVEQKNLVVQHHVHQKNLK